MEITGHYLTVDGIKTYYEENGPAGDLPTVLCIHIAGRESRQYHDMMEIFAGRARLIALDMPAHGKSWPLPRNQAIDNPAEYTEFVGAFISGIGLEGA